MDTVYMRDIVIGKRVWAIIQFGPATATSGMKGGEYYQVTLDPNMVSPGGDYIRFDQSLQRGSEVHGWQRIDALTVCEILGEVKEPAPVSDAYTVVPGASLTIKAVEKE